MCFNLEELFDKGCKSITNDFEEVEKFLEEYKSNDTVAFSPLNIEIIEQMDSYVASNKSKTENKKKISSVKELLKSIEHDESLFVSNTFNAGRDCVLEVKAGFKKTITKHEPSTANNIIENDMQNILEFKEKELDFRNIVINVCKSSLYFNGDLKNIFDKKKRYMETFNLRNNRKIMREFMSASKLIYVFTGKVNKKKFYVTILPFDVKNSQRYLVHLIPMENGIDLKELWSKFRKITNSNFDKLLKICKKKHVKLTVPTIKNLKSCVDRKSCFKSDEKFEVVFVQENYLTIDEGHLLQNKNMKECCLDGLPLFKIEIKADKPYLAFVYDAVLDKIIVILKDLGTH